LIRLSVPGTLQYRDLAMRFVTAACKLVEPGAVPRDFDDKVVSAFGEAFNNVALHAYRERRGELHVEVELLPDRMTLRLLDHGASFDLDGVPRPDLDLLHESGMGVFIIRSFMDEVTYTPGVPNVLSMTKHFASRERQS
jgi:serine/threonine-protein kinase RsbW